MALEPINEKLSLKNLLFTKAIPNHAIPVPTAGYKVYACIDCGDRFLFQSSYEYHVNRKSLRINYLCRHCSKMMIFYNRCNLLSHIRSHAFRTATINVYDLKIEPLPLNHFSFKNIVKNKCVKNKPSNKGAKSPKETSTSRSSAIINKFSVCFECKESISMLPRMAIRDRQRHYMQYTNEVHSCPICLFTLPTICGLKAHIRLHLRYPPYYCPECGINFSGNMNYPYNHDCDGFKMMRATARLKCSFPGCLMYHPNEFKDHIKQKHFKKVFKCPYCVVACFNEATMDKHLNSHKTETRASIFYQCELCPGKLVLQNHMDTHLKGHVNIDPVLPCWACGAIFNTATALISHHISQHAQTNMKEIYQSILNIALEYMSKDKHIYRVVMRCEQCKRCFTYKCLYNEIKNISTECPYKCTKDTHSSMITDICEPDISTMQHIKCCLCKSSISYNWDDIKTHFGIHHKSHKCLDAKLVLQKIDIQEYFRQNKQKVNKVRVKRVPKRPQPSRPQYKTIVSEHPAVEFDIIENTSLNDNSKYSCNKCGHVSESKEKLEIHIVEHRDPCMAYQCMECSQSFVVKPTFSKHLLLEHGIDDAEHYITTKNCYNEDALIKTQFRNNNDDNVPLKENQCRICRDEFDNLEDLEKHFRVHGMAFLLKNTSNKANTSP